jgi:hypothetical protein
MFGHDVLERLVLSIFIFNVAADRNKKTLAILFT